MEEYINHVIAPKIRGDGGWIEFASLERNELKVVLKGECSKCFVASRCMDWLQQEIRRDLAYDVKITAISNKPFFWDV